MNREQAFDFGVKQELYKDFQEQYNRDLNKRAREISERREGGKTALAVEYLRDAIGAMVRLIDDPARLSAILQDVNSQYYRHRNDIAANRFNAQMEALKQENAQEQCNTPETATGGGSTCQ